MAPNPQHPIIIGADNDPGEKEWTDYMKTAVENLESLEPFSGSVNKTNCQSMVNNVVNHFNARDVYVAKNLSDEQVQELIMESKTWENFSERYEKASKDMFVERTYKKVSYFVREKKKRMEAEMNNSDDDTSILLGELIDSFSTSSLNFSVDGPSDELYREIMDFFESAGGAAMSVASLCISAGGSISAPGPASMFPFIDTSDEDEDDAPVISGMEIVHATQAARGD